MLPCCTSIQACTFETFSSRRTQCAARSRPMLTGVRGKARSKAIAGPETRSCNPSAIRPHADPNHGPGARENSRGNAPELPAGPALAAGTDGMRRAGAPRRKWLRRPATPDRLVPAPLLGELALAHPKQGDPIARALRVAARVGRLDLRPDGDVLGVRSHDLGPDDDSRRESVQAGDERAQGGRPEEGGGGGV